MTISEPESHTLALLRRLDGKIDALAERLIQVEARLASMERGMATKELLASVLHVLELKIERAALGQLDEVGSLRQRVDALERRLRHLEELTPG